MSGWRRICCAVDLSPVAREAALVAADLAKRLHGSLTLFHAGEAAGREAIFAPPPAPHHAPPPEPELEGWAKELEALAGGPVETALGAGDPADEIVRFARNENYDLIVIGTEGRTGLAHIVHPSLAEKVARHAPCPVLVVPAASAASASR